MAEKKKAGRIRKGIDKIRKKIAPTFGEQFSKARKEGKKTFRSTRDDKKKGKDPYTYKRDCDEVLGSWGTLVGKAEGWTVNDTNTLKDLLNKYVATQKDQSKVGVASALLKAVESD